MADPNLELLTRMALVMGPLRGQVVFVGGCATGLLLTQPEVAEVRATEDVDAIVEVFTLASYHQLAEALAAQGFHQTMEANTPPFRWYWQRMQLDLVPLEESVMGFANRWYRPAFAAAVTSELAPGLLLRHLSAPYFLATKLEAFKDRGQNDLYLSHDLEDVITVADGRAEAVDELANAPSDVVAFVAETLRGVLAHPDFLNVLPGLVSEAARSGLVLQRLRQMATLTQA